ncbi:MAG: hypothetical protein LBP76_11805 [Treponema sp.]|jgi:uncharacterized protein YjbI with pentapeptide repeats|nr:hypothetical protein [Treponema sp.]
MGFYGRSNRLLIEQVLQKGGIDNSQIVECDLAGLVVQDAAWNHTDIRDLNAHGMAVKDSLLSGSHFYRSNFTQVQFLRTGFSQMTIDGLTLIKSSWDGCRITQSSIKNICMQRSKWHGVKLIASSLIDFEGLDITMDNCVVAHSLIRIGDGGGMNGFSGARISNCIFYHCRFEGFPLRGAVMRSDVFVHCSGEIGDTMDCGNVAGIGLRGRSGFERLHGMKEARKLIEEFTS